MSRPSFILDPRLDGDTRLITSLALCDVRLMNDARYAWLVLVPRRAGRVEITDLSADEQALLWQEVNRATAALRAVAPCDKLNLGALGNIVRQLHVHVVARCEGDAAWPGPVWGHGGAQPYAAAVLTARLDALREALAKAAG
ncbi:diadenosine tetraphosphate hydrolase [Rhodanobacter sp. B04]|uniref:HIT family protein n=1 Tax=Rhodanobacter sp. B04 TaxID=1945860 RepID=UPI0009857597|nr:HIT family protein [Rhodanobacter sp. B04]OOG63236.1 diadenosine tetraphosphate hydrolase [Rhodanobacter sp. B04]